LNINDREIFPYIKDCMCLNLSEKESFKYLDDKGFKIGPATYYRLKNEVKESTHERLWKLSIRAKGPRDRKNISNCKIR
jgi:hypothetical protein